MKVKRRRKSVRYPASKTHSRGRKNRTRGSGNRGGVGMSGTGKRGDQKKSLVIKLYGNDYFGKTKRGEGRMINKKLQHPTISLHAIANGLHGLIKKGIAKENKGVYEVNLEKYKIIGNHFPHESRSQIHIKAWSASSGAIEAVKKAGGKIELIRIEKETQKEEA